MNRSLAISLTLLAAATCAHARSVAAAEPPSVPPVDGPLLQLLGPSFPIEVNVSRPAALIHWLDSLAALRGPGVTAGKTVRVHRDAFRRVHGATTDADTARLRDYVELRRSLAGVEDGRRSFIFSECVFTAESVERMVSHCSRMLSTEDRSRLAAAVAHYDPRFEPIWQHGRVVREFLARVIASPQRDELAAWLVRLAAFYGVPAVATPPPRVVLAPVGFGGGTHAQALGRFLLIEVRPGEGLIHEVPPIAHETAHFLDERLPETRRRALRAAAGAHGPSGLAAWQLLHEALPTALAQGVAAERFQGRFWSVDDRWYHRDEIDAYAKLIFPIVRGALAARRTLDPALVDELVRAHPDVAPTPR